MVNNDTDYLEPFVYSSDWYDRVYHARKHKEEYAAKPDTHQLRDESCYRDANVCPNDRILICGCGGGNNAWSLVNTFDCRHLTLVDFAPASVEHCKRNFPFVEAIVADVSKLPFQDGTFDLVSALDIIEHLPHETYLRFLIEAYRVCKSRGRILILPGLTKRPEHINIVYPMAVAHDLLKVGFKRFSLKQQWVIAWKEAG